MSTVIEPDDEDESNEYRLIPCKKCTELFPAVMLDEHQELCKRFMEFVSLDDDLDFEAIADAAAAGNLDDRHIPADDESSDVALCAICQRKFPKSTIDDHQVLCQLLLEQYAGFEAIKSAKTSSPDNKVRSEPVQPVVPESRILERCDFCEERIPVDELEEHKYKCGSRAVSCSYCKIFYEIRDRESHILCKNMYENVSQSTPEEQKAPLPEEEPKSKNQGQNLVFDKDEAKDSLNEEQSFKMPNNPLLSCIDQTETEDVCYISDDDCGESLEDFWERARNFLKRQSMLNV